jgi:predicted nucleotidyltransferase
MSLSQDVLDRIIVRLRAAEPKLQAVVLCGSHARGEGAPFSDVDIMALTDGPPKRQERAWFEIGMEGQMLHVSVGAESLEDFEEAETEAASWALGFPVEDTMQLAWATPKGHAVLGDDPSEWLPAGTPELEDFVEFYMKVRRAEATDDRLLLRWAARNLAEYATGLLRPFNPVLNVRTPIEALRVALSFEEAPEHFRHDAELCMGLSPTLEPQIAQAAKRLVAETLSFLRERLGAEAFANDDIRAALRDGTLEAYVSSPHPAAP